MTCEATIWAEGYHTALHDFGIRPTGKQIEGLTRNPYTSPHRARTQLNDFERNEIRNALGYHFEDCPAEAADQLLIVETIVERILARRPARGA